MPIKSKDFRAPDFIVTDGDGDGVSIIRNMILTVVEGRSRGNVEWSAAFNVRNKTAGQGDDRENTALFVEFKKDNGAPAPIPGGRLVIFGWRDHCYFGVEGHKVREGSIDLPYDQFVNLAHSIELYHSAVVGEQGICNDSF